MENISNYFQSYELSWSVDSYSPIEEYRLLYRKIKPYHGVSVIKVGELSETRISLNVLYLKRYGGGIYFRHVFCIFSFP